MNCTGLFHSIPQVPNLSSQLSAIIPSQLSNLLFQKSLQSFMLTHEYRSYEYLFAEYFLLFGIEILIAFYYDNVPCSPREGTLQIEIKLACKPAALKACYFVTLAIFSATRIMAFRLIIMNFRHFIYILHSLFGFMDMKPNKEKIFISMKPNQLETNLVPWICVYVEG